VLLSLSACECAPVCTHVSMHIYNKRIVSESGGKLFDQGSMCFRYLHTVYLFIVCGAAFFSSGIILIFFFSLPPKMVAIFKLMCSLPLFVIPPFPIIVGSLKVYPSSFRSRTKQEEKEKT